MTGMQITPWQPNPFHKPTEKPKQTLSPCMEATRKDLASLGKILIFTPIILLGLSACLGVGVAVVGLAASFFAHPISWIELLLAILVLKSFGKR
jgi:hypothetical protein